MKVRDKKSEENTEPQKLHRTFGNLRSNFRSGLRLTSFQFLRVHAQYEKMADRNVYDRTSER